MTRLVLVMVAVLGAAVADAAPDEATIKLAKAHYEKGNAAYNLGKFDEAIGEFTKAYEAWPVPDFLYNIAQSYRLAGNCKQALFVYKRYLSIKDKDKDAPLAKKERAEIERFIKELSECAARADAAGQTPPDTLKTTPTTPETTPTTTSTGAPTSTSPSTSTTTSPTTTTTTTAAPTTTASVGDDEEEEPSVSATASPVQVRVLKAYAAGGVAVFSAGELSVPVQASFAVGAGYPVVVGPAVLDFGLRLGLSPIKYDTMTATEQAMLIGVRATAGASYPINPQLAVRGELGVGVAMLRGLVDGNPFTDTREAGGLTMPSVRLGVGAEYAFTPNFVGMVAPGVGFAKAPAEAFMSSLIQLDVLVGLGYRM